MKLTEKQKRFVEEYLIDLNATRAYKAAGYSVNSNNASAVEGHKLLRNPKIEKYLDERMKEREKRTEITQDGVVKELSKIGFAKMADFLKYKTTKAVVEYDEEGEPVIDYRMIVDLIDSEEIDTSAVQEVSISRDGTFKFKLYDKMKALELLGRHLRIFDEKDLQNEIEKLDKILEGLNNAAK